MKRDDATLLRIDDLHISFDSASGPMPVVSGVSLSVPRGETVAIVGESGCGKSVTALSILRLIPQPLARIERGKILLDSTKRDGVAGVRSFNKTEPRPSGSGPNDTEPRPPAPYVAQRCRGSGSGSVGPGDVDLLDTPSTNGQCDLLKLTEDQLRSVRGRRIAMIFQDPMSSLNPVYSIGEQIVEAIELHQGIRGRRARAAAVEMLDRVGISDPHVRVRHYPHQLSGGMRQRVMIAMALACKPDLLIADEPTTALDVTIQAQILELLRSLQREFAMSILFITHDLGVVAEIADYVYVMYAGRIVEHGATCDVLHDPGHPYTQALLNCMPRIGAKNKGLDPIPGQVPHPSSFPSGCRFHPRCRLSAERANNPARVVREIASDTGSRVLRRCVERYADEPSGVPELRAVGPGHFAACWEVGDINVNAPENL